MAGDVHEMLQRVLSREAEGYAWLYDSFATKLYRRLSQRYAHAGGLEAADLLQDAFLFFLQNDHRVLRYFLDRTPRSEQTEQRFERHLWDLACGVASNRRRSAAQRKGTVPLGHITEVTASPEPGAERRLVDRDRLQKLNDCLERSSERVYLYFKMRFADGLAPEEICAATGWSRRSTYKLRQALNKAVDKCAEALGLELTGGDP